MKTIRYFSSYNRSRFSCSTIPYLILGSTKYVLGKNGAKDCEKGSIISDRSECEAACDDLNIQKGTLWNAGVCFVRTNGKCGMNGIDKISGTAPLICKISGI